MVVNSRSAKPPDEIFKALRDPVRWRIVAQMAAVEELAYVTLADTLPVVKPTISHHMKILYEAGLINVRKSGRNLYYSLRRDVLHKLIDELWELAAVPRPAASKQNGRPAVGQRRTRADGAPRKPARKARASHDNAEEVIVLTW
jgi:DNA-binding transcriptional ArsR family regulator